MAAAEARSLEVRNLAAALATVPVSGVADLLSADLAWRRRAAERLAEEIVSRLDGSGPGGDARQMSLPL